MKWAQDGVLKESVPYMPEQRKAFQERHSENWTLESYSLGAELGVTLTHKDYSYCITIYISHSIHPDPGSLPHQLWALKWMFGPLTMLNLHCQLDWVLNYHGNRLVAVSLRMFPDKFHWGRMTQPTCGQLRSLGSEPTQKRTWVKRQCVSVLASRTFRPCGQTHHTSIVMLSLKTMSQSKHVLS